VDRGMTRFAAAADGGSSILIYRLPAPPPALPERRCQVTGPAGSFFRPTWSPDGSTLAWQEDDGIHTLRIDVETCEGTSSLAIPGGKHPDWGPAAAGSALTATAPRRIRLGALLTGLRVKVKCSCTARATLLLAGRAIGRTKRAVSGSATLRVKPTRAGRARLLRGGKSVSVKVAGAGRTVTRKVRIVR
jgi:hypothetical protein